MQTFLLKTEPDDYSYADLVRDKKTTWAGVANPAALANMRQAKAGDQAFIYHTGDQKAIFGLAKITSAPYPDPKSESATQTAAGETKTPVFDIEPLRAAKTPVTLATLKADPRFADFALVKQPRLSAMLVPPALDKIVRELAGF